MDLDRRKFAENEWKEIEQVAAELEVQDSKLKASSFFKYGALTLFGLAAVVQVGLFYSAVPAVLGKGAPFMATSRKALNALFRERFLVDLVPKKHQQLGKAPVFLDLGSGDGRVVIEAARHGYQGVGIELNPLLVGVSWVWSMMDRNIAPLLSRNRKRWPEGASATFQCKDLWKIDFSDADVIMVFGLTPIMDRLSIKLRNEAKADAIILSNVFQLNDPVLKQIGAMEQVYIYRKIELKNDKNKMN